MTVEEFDIALSELETRVDRLRALYENWFRGYEKSEPMVPRKDCERRVYALRKELPRNTALRFRYHQLYLKYTTLANYWQRTARQIEEGTYKPQLQRLKRKLDREQELAERKERRKLERPEDKKDGPGGYELDLDESLDVDDLLDALELEEVAKAIEKPGPHGEPEGPPTTLHARLPPVNGPAVATFSRQKAGDLPKPQAPAAQHGAALGPRAAPAPNAPFSPNVPGRAAPQAAPGTPSATTIGRPAPLAQPPATQPGAQAPRVPSPPAASQTASRPGLPPPTPGPASPARPLPGATGAGPQRPMPGAPSAAGPGTGARPGVPSHPTGGTRPGVPSPPAAPARPATTTLGRPAPHVPTAAGVPRPAPAAGAQSGGTYVGRPPATSPLAAANGAPNEQRLRHIYDEYAAARRRNNEGEVRYEALVSSIQKMLPELSKKHGGKAIDFDVVVKDGRVGLKPKAT